MESYRVFISSIMNSTEDLQAEREATRAAVDHFGPITSAWAFEAEPASPKPLLSSYIDAVKTSDLFVLILGQHVTEPVKAEFEAARDHAKPILVFCKTVPVRETETGSLLRSLNVKYDSFVDATELREKVRKALGFHLLHLIRGESGVESPGDRIAQLRALARTKKRVRIAPLIPKCEYDTFSVKDIQNGALLLDKESSHQQVTIPAQRVTEILPGGRLEQSTVLLAGRLQWLTLAQTWEFFTEQPEGSAGLGVAKDSSMQDPAVIALGERIAASGRHLTWSHLEKVAERINAGTHEVFYDTDGRYFRHRGIGREAVVLISR